MLSYAVTTRTQEFGVRIALGTTPQDSGTNGVPGGQLLIAAGLAAGIIVPLFATGLIRATLFGIQPMDAVAVSLVELTVSTVGLIAACGPALRATRVDVARVIRRVEGAAVPLVDPHASRVIDSVSWVTMCGPRPTARWGACESAGEWDVASTLIGIRPPASHAPRASR